MRFIERSKPLVSTILAIALLLGTMPFNLQTTIAEGGSKKTNVSSSDTVSLASPSPEGTTFATQPVAPLPSPTPSPQTALSATANRSAQLLSPEAAPVVQETVYGQENPSDIPMLKALTLEKQGLSSLSGNLSMQRQARIDGGVSADLSQAEVEELARNGASAESIYWVNFLNQSYPDAYTPLELLMLHQKKGLSWEDIWNELQSTAAAEASPTTVEDSVYEAGLPSLLLQRQTVTDVVYNKDSLSSLQLEQATLTTTSFDLMVASVLESNVKEAQINQTNKPQFGDRSTTNETIDPVSGSLSWKQNLISLPGRDGLNLDVGIMYNSNIPFSFRYTQDGNYTSAKGYSPDDLGTGWSFQFPSITRSGGTSYYHDGHGSVYPIVSHRLDWNELIQYTGFLNYYGKNMRYVDNNTHDFSNGQDSSFTYVEYLDKKREYFSSDGRLLGIVDRFGNSLTFNYTYQYGYNLLSSITDTLGRQVTFSYENSLQSATFDGDDIVIQVKDQGVVTQSITLTKGRVLATANNYSQYVPFLWSITNQLGEKTYFNYSYQWAKYNPQSQYYGYQDFNFYTLLSKITYPHSNTEYGYELTNRHIGYYELVEEYRVTSRSDHTGSHAYNQINYSYDGDYSGGAMDQYPGNIPESYQYSSIMTVTSSTKANGQTIKNTFNGKGQLLSTETRAANGERHVESNTAFHDTFIYSPTRTQSSDYGAGENHLYAETTYTDLGLVSSQTELLTADQFNNTGLKQHYTKTYTYEPNYQLLSSKVWYSNESDTSSKTESYTYTSDGRVATTTNALGEQTAYAYTRDGSGKVQQVAAESQSNNKVFAKSIVLYSEGYAYAYPTEQQQWFNLGTTQQTFVKKQQTYDHASGLLLTESDGEGHTTTYEYDAGGRLKKETHPDRTNTTGGVLKESTVYNYYNQTSSNFDAENAGAYVLKVDSIKTLTYVGGSSVSTYANTLYNGMGLALLEEHLDENAGKWVFTQYHYDDQGRAIYQSDGLGNVVTADYDEWGRPSRSVDASGNAYVNTYNLIGRQTTSYVEDPTTLEKWNYLETINDPWGRVQSQKSYYDWPSQSQPIQESYRYDIAGNVTGYTDPMNHQNDTGVTTAYTYDALNRLTSVQDALNQTTRYTYDGTGQISKVTVQAKGGTEQTLNTKTYNEIGLPTVKQDGSSQTESLNYNSLGQLSSRTDRNGSVFNYSYDESGQQKSMTVSGTVNNVAQTQSTELIFGDTTPYYQTTKQYTGTQIQSSQRINVDSLNQVRNRYDIAYSSGVSVHASNIFNQRDVLGRITQLNDNYLNFYVNYQYNKQRLDKVQTNGTSALTTDGSTNVQYSYYANDLVKSITYPTLTDGSTLKTEYTYNKAMGWVETMRNSKGSNVLSSFSYGYDNNGNIVSTSEVRSNGSAQTTSYGYDALNRLTSITRPDGGSTTYTYDVRGNRQTLSDTSSASLDMTDTSYTYDLFNTLTSVTKGSSTTSFKYYADGLRYLKSTGTTSSQVNYDFNGQVITEEKLSGGYIVQQSTYVRGDRLLVKKDKTAGKDYYYLYNGHGDVVQIVDTSGNVVNSYSYDAWGNITSQTEGVSNSFKYAGEMYDAETGLYYLRARYYDPSIGRFINEDTYEGQIDNPLSLNLYTYVHNNPLKYNDPSGHKVNEVEVDIYLDLAIQEGNQSQAWWTIRSILGQEAQKFWVPNNEDNNYFKYLFNMATGYHYEENTPGTMGWARGVLQNWLKLSSDFQTLTDPSAVFIGPLGGLGKAGKAASLIKAEESLVKAAQQMGKNPVVQKEADDLIFRFLNGNTNPGIGSKYLVKDIYYLRGKEGARVFYRMKDGEMQILAKANKANEQTVINILYKVYGKK